MFDNNNNKSIEHNNSQNFFFEYSKKPSMQNDYGIDFSKKEQNNWENSPNEPKEHNFNTWSVQRLSQINDGNKANNQNFQNNFNGDWGNLNFGDENKMQNSQKKNSIFEGFGNIENNQNFVNLN